MSNRDSTGSKDNIGDLAQESSHKHKATWLPAIPLTLLAPVLIGLALLGVLLPNTIILTNASDETAQLVTQKYLSELISDVSFRCQTPIAAILPVIQSAVANADITDLFAGPRTSFQMSGVAPYVAILRQKNGLDNLVCSTASWRAGYDETNSPVLNTTSVSRAIINSLKNPATGNDDTIAFLDDDKPTQFRAYDLDPLTHRILNTSNPLVFPYPDYTMSMQMALKKKPTFGVPYFLLSTVSNSGYTGAYLGLTRVDGNPVWGCSGGINVGASWITMLQKIKPMERSIVAILQLDDLFFPTNFTVLSSSNMVTTGVSIDARGNPQYATAKVDERTASMRLQIMQKFPTVSAAEAAALSNTSFEITLDNERFIAMMGVTRFAFNYRVLNVVTMPRDEIYGKIDAARTRSRAMSIGISVGVTALIAAIFVAAVLPLFSLAQQMEGLTKLDFGTLESSGALDRRSWVWELRKVQIVFATMVKAFAGAIKKNKQMLNKNHNTGSSVSAAGSKQTNTAVTVDPAASRKAIAARVANDIV
ncbi:uncharacterized protein EV422DRAFT_570342 [Fimicolochytrium jonesii]|uniref:uncharacterized protein n=1 Tax=Fimicolochytrium jonesii TaxID=1396493 RepID=UPI0022FDED87|nr:uncharacterized protein EV422DRAFT_570342 [Fimicolochytrium jonesii]KAI8817869.1 hypothetical protein EV422DRAFT_570342 [Fimicolochytrium jonesii]